MANEKDDGGGSNVEPHPLGLALDIYEWRRAGQVFLRWIEQVERNVPPIDRGRAAELSFLLRETDGQFERWVEQWKTIIRPGLKKYEGAEPPEGTFL